MEVDEIIEKIKKKTNQTISLEIDKIISSGNTGSEILYHLGHYLENDLDEGYKKLIEEDIKSYRAYCASLGIDYK